MAVVEGGDQVSAPVCTVVSMAPVDVEGCTCATDAIHDLIFSRDEKPLAESPGKDIFSSVYLIVTLIEN